MREFVEDRAFLKAVVSLPQETFISSGASVKASLLFLQKYTDEENERFDQTCAGAKTEIEAKHAGEIAGKPNALKLALQGPKKTKMPKGARHSKRS